MISTFENCQKLKTVNILGFNVDKLSSMHKLFYNSGINSFTPQFNFTSNIEDMSYMFASSSIVEFKFNIFNINKVTNMSHMFEDCESLTNIDMTNSDINKSKLKDISYMFHSCESLLELDLSEFNTKEVVDMSHLLQNCISLGNVK